MKHAPIKHDIWYMVSNCLAFLAFPFTVRGNLAFKLERFHTILILAGPCGWWLKMLTIPRCKWAQVSANANIRKLQRGCFVFCFLPAKWLLALVWQMKGSSEPLMCTLLLYRRMFGVIWIDWIDKQKASGPGCWWWLLKESEQLFKNVKRGHWRKSKEKQEGKIQLIVWFLILWCLYDDWYDQKNR